MAEQIEALGLRQVARDLHIRPGVLYQACYAGEIPYFNVSGSIRVRPESIRAWMERKEAETRRIMGHPTPMKRRGQR